MFRSTCPAISTFCNWLNPQLLAIPLVGGGVVFVGSGHARAKLGGNAALRGDVAG
jgi:hypothetical protein